jgi:hypothetical protein
VTVRQSLWQNDLCFVRLIPMRLKSNYAAAIHPISRTPVAARLPGRICRRSRPFLPSGIGACAEFPAQPFDFQGYFQEARLARISLVKEEFLFRVVII